MMFFDIELNKEPAYILYDLSKFTREFTRHQPGEPGLPDLVEKDE